MHNCRGSGDSTFVSRSTYPDPFPRNRNLASPPDLETMSFIFPPPWPMMRFTTWKSSLFSMPMKKRQVYFAPPRFGDRLGDLSAGLP